MVGEESDNSELKVTLWMNHLQLLNAIRPEQTYKRLMHMEIEMGGQKVVTLVDSGVTHNFVSPREAIRLDLKLCKDSSKLKAMKSKAQETQGLAKDMAI